jgi:hypothetical protein
VALAPTPSIINNHDASASASATAMRPYSDGRGPSCMHVADDAGTVLAVIHILPPYPLMTTAPSPCAQPLHTQPCSCMHGPGPGQRRHHASTLRSTCVACGAGGDRDGNGSDSDRILQISLRNHICGCNQYPPMTVSAGRNLYPYSCPSDFEWVSDIRWI